MESSPNPPRKSKRWRNLGCLAVLILGVGLATAPRWAGPWIRTKVEGALADSLQGQATIQDLALTWGGSLRMGGLELHDADGSPLLRMESLQANAKPWDALRSRYRANAQIRGFEIHLHQDAQGAWNWAPPAASDGDQVEASPDPSRDAELDLVAELSWEQGTLILTGPGGVSRFVQIEGQALWPGGGQAGTLEASLSTPGQTQPAITLRGDLRAGPAFDLASIAGTLRGQLQEVSTDALQALFDPAEGPAPEGTLNGEWKLIAQDFAATQPEDSPWHAKGQFQFEGRWPVVSPSKGTTPDGQDSSSQGVPDAIASNQSSVDRSNLEARGDLATIEWLEQSAQLQFDVRAGPLNPSDLGQGLRIAIDGLRYQSPTAQLEVAGTGEIGPRPEQLAADLNGTLQTPLKRLIADLRPLLGWSELDLQGDLDMKFDVQGVAGRLRTKGELRAQAMQLRAAVDAENTLEFQDPDLKMSWAASFDREARALSIEGLELTSQTVSGKVAGRVLHQTGSAAQSGFEPSDPNSSGADPSTPSEDQTPVETDLNSLVESLQLAGVRAQWTYIPDRLGALLRPWLPGELVGSEPREIKMEFDGRLADLDLAALLQGLQGRATIGLGHYRNFGLETSGQLKVENQGAALVATGALEANGGRATLDSRLQMDPNDPAPSTMRFAVESIRTNPEVASILALVHPAFQSLDAARTGDLTGLLSANLDLSYAGAIRDSWLQGQMQGIDWSLVEGTGAIQLVEASFAGSPLMSEILQLLGKPASTPIRLKPLQFQIQGGRIHYKNPWRWTVEGAQTQFEGSVGLDQSLDLSWSVPITPQLVQKHKLLRSLTGQAITIPIRGSITRPKIDVGKALSQLAKEGVQQELRDVIEKELGDRLGKELGKLKGSGGDPQSMLTEADRLYAAGKKAEAIAIYKELRKSHQASVVYLLHRKRIKSRSRE